MVKLVVLENIFAMSLDEKMFSEIKEQLSFIDAYLVRGEELLAQKYGLTVNDIKRIRRAI